jgi:uncharacterized protein (DUF1501 family)
MRLYQQGQQIMHSTRRIFIKGGALALIGAARIPDFLTRAAFAETLTPGMKRNRLVVIFQRGAADGLNIVVPYAEPSYYQMRPTIAIQQNQLIDLDGFFGLHPAMADFKPLYDAGHLAIVHATGSPDMSRSHFDAQDYMESGTPGVKATVDGWLNRAVVSEGIRPTDSAFRTIAMGEQVPRTLEGTAPAVAINDVASFSVGDRCASPTAASNAFQSMYDSSSDSLLHTAGDETFEAVKMLRAANPAQYKPTPGANYPNGGLGSSLKQLAQLMKADLGVEVAFADIGGWDTHQNQGAADGQLAGRLKEFSSAIAAFWTDMGAEVENITLVTMSEFGRTARQNGTGGTDHGHANAMFVLGGEVKGGKVYGRWPGLAPEQLNEGRDLAVTTDFRQVLTEATQHALGIGNMGRVFPGYSLGQHQPLRFV